MKFLLGLFVVLAGLSAQAAQCEPFDSMPICAQVQFTQGPVNRAESQFVVKFFSTETGAAVDPQNLKVDIWMEMSGHGHGHGSGPVTVTKQDFGVYFVTEVYFVMHGEWQLRFFTQDTQGRQQRGIVYTNVPR